MVRKTQSLTPLLFLIFFHNYNTAPRWLPQVLHLDHRNVITLCHNPHSLLSDLIWSFYTRILWRSRKFCHHDWGPRLRSYPSLLRWIVVMSWSNHVGNMHELSYNAKLLATNLNTIISSLTHTSLSLFPFQIKQWYSYSDKSKLQTLRLTSTSYQPSSHDTHHYHGILQTISC